MPPRAPPQLAPHLSYKSALVLIPPTSIQPPIQKIRQKHDKQFHRWPPHINLLYPFLAGPSSERPETSSGSSTTQPYMTALKDEILTRLKPIAQQVDPFQVSLLAKPKHFRHGKRSATVWLEPADPVQPLCCTGSDNARTTHGQLYNLQASLQAEFSECDADTRNFTPHLSLGQCGGEPEVTSLIDEAEAALVEFAEQAEPCVADNANAGRDGTHLADLEWLVDRVFVIERKGYGDPFRLVGEVRLGQNAL